MNKMSLFILKKLKNKSYLISSSFFCASFIFLPNFSMASMVSAEIDYQIFRDFAENKGVFKAGATDIPIYDKNKNLLGYLSNAPMIDFSSINVNITPGVATLIHPQYIVSVSHNSGYQSVQFGNTSKNPDNNFYSYQIVARNNKTDSSDGTERTDFHVPRLDKLVTETIPAETSKATYSEILDSDRFTIFYRAGSGNQYVISNGSECKKFSNCTEQVGNAYSYLTGGSLQNVTQGSNPFGKTNLFQFHFTAKDFAEQQGLLSSLGKSGDSGSAIFGWDSQEKKWLILGVYTLISGNDYFNNAIYLTLDHNLIDFIMKNNTDKPIVFDTQKSGPLNWIFDNVSGIGSLVQSDNVFNMNGKKDSDLDHGNDLVFSGKGGIVNLINDIYQGAGALTFKDNYTVSSSDDKVWTGAGLIVEQGVILNWEVKGVLGDALHKIGAGTLNINGKGMNYGDLRVGDGTVLLNQAVDNDGNQQAFNKITLTSGRPTVVLADANQVNPDNIYFGYRGGRLDVNGNNLNFSRIKNSDFGAQIVNHNADTAAHLIISGLGIGNTDQTFMGMLGETESTKINGSLSLTYAPNAKRGTLNLSGGANLNGDLNVANGGTLLLSGSPVAHAGDIIIEGDWNTSLFRVNNVNVDHDSSLQVTEFTTLYGNIHAGEASSVILGYNDGKTSRCTVNNTSGATECSTITNNPVNVNAKAVAKMTGRIFLDERANLDIGAAVLTGDIQGKTGSRVMITDQGVWKMDRNSTLSQFGSKGGHIFFHNEDEWRPKTLVVDYMDAINLQLSMGVSEEGELADRIDILSQAIGYGNLIDLSMLIGQDLTLNKNVTLASAPIGVSHDYFSFNTINQGFTKYVLDTQVIEDGEKVLWQLKGSGSSEKTDNIPLIREARDIFSTREYILSNNISQWQQIIDNISYVSGTWALAQYSHGGYSSFSINQKGIDFGIKKVQSKSFWGIGVQLVEGKSQSWAFRDNFKLSGINLFYGTTMNSGGFIDGAIGYLRLVEDTFHKGELNSFSSKVSSNITTLGGRIGYRYDFDTFGITLTPSLSLDAAWMDGYLFNGKNIDAKLHPGNAIWGNVGILVEKLLSKGSVSFGIYRTIQVKDMPSLTLSDFSKSRRYNAVNDDRYNISLNIGGDAMDNLRVQMTLKSSFGGYFKTDAEGHFGVIYSF